MLYYIGNKNTIALLQDGKGRFYQVQVNAGRNLVVSRDRAPLLAEYGLKYGIRELESLDVHQHPGGGELWLSDGERGGDVRTVGTANAAFSYEPGWLSLCITAAGQDRKRMSRAYPAETIPGWEWICREDGSGYLRSLDRRSYFSYTLLPDFHAVKYRLPDQSFGRFEGNNSLPDSLLRQFRSFAEQQARRELNL